MQSSVRPSHSSKTGWSCRLILLLVVILIFSGWVLVMHNFSLSRQFEGESSASTVSTVSDSSSAVQMKKLLHEAQLLMKEITQMNVSHSTQMVKDLHKITRIEQSVDKRADSLFKDLQMAQSALQACQGQLARDNIHHTPSPPLPPLPHGSLSKVLPTPPAAIKKRWLVVVIPTVARPHNEDYLLQTLSSFAQQLPSDPSDLLYHQLLLHIVNFQVNNAAERKHEVFEKARSIYESKDHPLHGYFLFTTLEASEVLPDPVPHATAKSDPGTPNRPGFIVRRQTRNIATAAYKSLGLADHFLFLEDDMPICPLGLQAVQYMLNKASRYFPRWFAIRASYGMNGIFMHDADLPAFIAYLIDEQRRRPPDHLVVEYYAGETPRAKALKQNRANVGFKYNLFSHLGEVSTLRPQKMVGFPRCYELLVEPTVFKVEAYSPRECPRDDIWPCNVAHPDHKLIDWARAAHET